MSAGHAQIGCRYYADGNCTYGDKCHYDHSGGSRVHPGDTSFIPRGSHGPMTDYHTYSVPKRTKNCRNMIAYGACNVQGCDYNHEVDRFEPSGTEFIPSSDMQNRLSAGASGSSTLPGGGCVGVGYRPSMSYSAEPDPMGSHERDTRYYHEAQYNSPDARFRSGEEHYSGASYSSMPVYPKPTATPGDSGLGHSWEHPSAGNRYAVTSGGTTYFYTPDAGSGKADSLYFTCTSRAPTMGKDRRTLRSYFVSEDLRKEFYERAREIYGLPDPADGQALPQLVGCYRSLASLSSSVSRGSLTRRNGSNTLFQHPNRIYKCVSTNDRVTYAMRRFEGYPSVSKEALTAADKWRDLRHPNLVQLQEVFTTNEFGDNSLIAIYDFYPCSKTLAELHFDRVRLAVSEDILWSYLVQIISALRVIHRAGLACRVLSPYGVIQTSKNRIRISGAGVFDVMNHIPQQNVTDFQKEDMIALGQLMLCLGNKKRAATENMEASLQHLHQTYSASFCSIVEDLMSTKITSLSELYAIPAITEHILEDNANMHSFVDYLEGEVAKELEAGRLFRLVAKLGFVNGRPEYKRNHAWSEFGERYVLILFEHYLFHQRTEKGYPDLDMAHVIDTLNKLDTGSSERILLTDEDTAMIISFADLKNYIENAYKELSPQ